MRLSLCTHCCQPAPDLLKLRQLADLVFTHPWKHIAAHPVQEQPVLNVPVNDLLKISNIFQCKLRGI